MNRYCGAALRGQSGWQGRADRPSAATVCGDRQRNRHVTCASCTSVCYTPPVHPMHYACSCTAPKQEHAHLTSSYLPQLFSLLCSLHCVPPPSGVFADMCTHCPSSPSLHTPRCSRRLPRMRPRSLKRKCLVHDGSSHGPHVTNWDFILGFSFFLSKAGSP